MKRSFHHKLKVLALIDRDTCKARTMVIDHVNAATIMPIVHANVAKEARIMTDEHRAYASIRYHFAGHGVTSHSTGEYVNLAARTIQQYR